jgi:acetyl-CoA carboxylase biotin carboxyl carrier protein
VTAPLRLAVISEKGDAAALQNRGGNEMATDVPAHITGTVWKIEKKVGDPVNAGDVLVILESMKMELPVEAPIAGKVLEIRCKETEPVSEGQVLVVLG